MNGPLTLPAFVDSLRALTADQIDLERVSGLLGRVALTAAEVDRAIHFADDHYTRHKIFRNDLFDVLFLCWRPGQLTPVHNHNGQMGWVRVLRGRLEETSYRTPTGDPAADLSAIEIDDDMVGHGVELTETGRAVVEAGTLVATVDSVRQIHRLGNALEHARGEDAVSLHLYSRPHDSCLTFDVEARTCRRKTLRYDSEVDARGMGA